MTDEELNEALGQLLLAYKMLYHEYLTEYNLQDIELYRGGFYAQILGIIADTEGMEDKLKLGLMTAMVRIMVGAIDHIHQVVPDERQLELRTMMEDMENETGL